MPGYNFTEDVRKILATAREEAARLHHEYVGTEHILLAYTTPPQSTPAQLLQRAGAPPDAIRGTIDQTVRRGALIDIHRDLPYTSRAKKILELALTEARSLGHDFVGIEHLLLGIIREEKGIAAQVLAMHGVRADAVRAQVPDRPPHGHVVDEWQGGIKVIGVAKGELPPVMPEGDFVRTVVRATPTPRLHRGVVLALSILWAAFWMYLQPDILSWRVLALLLLIVTPPILLWRLTRR